MYCTTVAENIYKLTICSNSSCPLLEAARRGSGGGGGGGGQGEEGVDQTIK